GQAIEPRRLDDLMSHEAEVAPALIVADDHDDVGFRGVLAKKGAGQPRETEPAPGSAAKEVASITMHEVSLSKMAVHDLAANRHSAARLTLVWSFIGELRRRDLLQRGRFDHVVDDDRLRHVARLPEQA